MKIQRDKPEEKQDEKNGNGNDAGEVAETPPYKISIKQAIDVRRLLVSIINSLRAKEIDVPRARAIIYASQVLLNVFSQVDLEDRIQKLESLTGYGGR